ncbi:MAG TPA: lysylphosphatidylglycerol synthase transmembrane domain-containing protein, partial [Chthoniobacteraceae bacterium]|nr:lysylphosphatidylglycerol synthase transmembrane domain-containing protein [Chthoniobacteraceae bacterium]
MTKKQTFFTIAKIVVAAIVLTLIFYKVGVGNVWDKVRNASLPPILAGVVLCWFTIFIAGLRWHRLLRAFEIRIPLFALVCIAQIGQFFIVFLPGPAGDDITRMVYISRLSKSRVAEACASVLLDRCIGLASILLLAVVCMPRQWHVLSGTPQTYWPALVVSVAGGVVLIGAALFFLVDGAFMQRLVAKCLGALNASKLRDELGIISGRVFSQKRAVAEVMAAAIGTQLLLCLCYYLAGRSVGIGLPVSFWLGFVPVVLAANAVPITPAGVGVRESLLVVYLGLVHVPQGTAIATSFIAFGMMIAIYLLGGIVY